MTTLAFRAIPAAHRNTDRITDIEDEESTDTTSYVDTDTSISGEVTTNGTVPSPPRRSLGRAIMLEIWKHTCTAPSRLPGVHIFALEAPLARRASPFVPRWLPLGPPKVAPKDGGYGWYFRNFNITAPSFDAHNPSTYLVDSGLWNACKESRNHMLEAYGVKHWKRLRTAYPQIFFHRLERQALMELPLVVYFRDRGIDRYFSFFPNKDLIYLQTIKIEHVIWSWKMRLGGDPWTLCSLPNIALELNPA
ncbi:uncharacterized protein TRIVIDRAFT_223676 [Trichoderma virens Gv29-8]|uniref:Uncharacterized protein n=1 Tax=Hypocrea virens (strain Gv29-8 / FGSC 10586) TaxID=413071 RepID=G9MXU8_HYPVG|nr:uncharacterized protein TRIVIDRAFT_223676 [Trichoderma virens Gv29-8]EHK20709.1 hypothetical protein TRIVIDRAFT_223676 [Trichoderma virens Gv29-8]